MEDLRDQTHGPHYELYRRCKLEEMGFKDTNPEKTIQFRTYEVKRNKFLEELQKKEEEMRQIFIQSQREKSWKKKKKKLNFKRQRKSCMTSLTV